MFIECRKSSTYLAINFDHGLAMAGVDLVPAIVAQRNPGQIRKLVGVHQHHVGYRKRH